MWPCKDSDKYYGGVVWRVIHKMIFLGDRLDSIFTYFLLAFPGVSQRFWDGSDARLLFGFIGQNWLCFSGSAVAIFFVILFLRENYKNVEIIKPDLIIDYQEGAQSYQQWVPKQKPEYQLHRIRIYNKGETQAKGVRVRLKTVIPMPVNGVNGLPMDLHVMRRDCGPGKNLPTFDLDGKADEFIDVISFPRRDSVGHHYLLWPAGSYNEPEPIFLTNLDETDLVIEILAEGRKLCEKIYKLVPIDDFDSPVAMRFMEEKCRTVNT